MVKYTYDTWGKPVSITDGNGNDVSSNASHVANINPFRYRGYYYDAESGLYYLKTRYYDPETGRFINGDVFMSTGQGVIGCNMFCYCLNNPVNMADESGCVANYNTMMTDGGYSGHDDYYVYIIIKGKNEAQFLLNRCDAKVLDDIEEHGMIWTCDSIAEQVINKYEEIYGEHFIAGKQNISYEIWEHIEGYLWSCGYKQYTCPMVFYAYYMYECIFKGEKISATDYMYRKCKTVEMSYDSVAENIYFYGILRGR